MKQQDISRKQFMFVDGKPRSHSIDYGDVVRMLLNVEVSESRFSPVLDYSVSFKNSPPESLTLVTYNPRMFSTFRRILQECFHIRATIELTGIMTIRPVGCPGVNLGGSGLYEGDLVVRSIEGWKHGVWLACCGFSEGMQLN